MTAEKETEINEQIQAMMDKIQAEIEPHMNEPDVMLVYANVFLGLSKEILGQISSPSGALRVFDFYRNMIKGEIENTTIH